MAFRSEWIPNGVIWKFSGHVTVKDLELAHESFYSDPRSDSIRFRIVDTTKLTRSDVQRPDIERLAAYEYGSSLSIKRHRVALVA